MVRLRLCDLEQINQCILEVYAQLDLTAFRSHVLPTIKRLIPADSLFYTDIDLSNPRASQAVMEPANVMFPIAGPEVADLVVREHPAMRHWMASRQPQPCTMSDFLTRPALHRLDLYQLCYRQMAIEYQLTVNFIVADYHMAAVVLNRPCTDFSARDRQCLTLLTPHLRQAYQNVQALSRLALPNGFNHQEITQAAQGRLPLDRHGHPEGDTRAVSWLGDHFDMPRRQTARLPDDLRRWTEDQHARFMGDADPSEPRQPLCKDHDGERLTVRFMTDTAGQPFLFLEKKRMVHDSARLKRLGMTEREAEVLFWVAQGKTNQDIADILGSKRRTVEKHLERIYQRLGVENRTTAAARALEILSAPDKHFSAGLSGV